jgi:hypothetical protein
LDFSITAIIYIYINVSQQRDFTTIWFAGKVRETKRVPSYPLFYPMKCWVHSSTLIHYKLYGNPTQRRPCRVCSPGQRDFCFRSVSSDYRSKMKLAFIILFSVLHVLQAQRSNTQSLVSSLFILRLFVVSKKNQRKYFLWNPSMHY